VPPPGYAAPDSSAPGDALAATLATFSANSMNSAVARREVGLDVDLDDHAALAVRGDAREH
jgi:hypothetical protein